MFFGPDGSMMSAKWHNIKIWLRYCEGFDKPIVKPAFPLVFDLGSDPQRAKQPLQRQDGHRLGVRRSIMKSVIEYEKSFAQYPNIKPGQEFDGYPPAAAAGNGSAAPVAR